jgi:hypothetical protein|tara:strand:+ start:215 stop:373 length:159 start_codon:yes stop_codon:yes gene_type:complete
MSDKKTLCITNVDKDSWKKFRGTALLSGFDSGADCVRYLIRGYAEGEINVKK